MWRCRVCEGVNRGGRVCATCGAVVAAGEPLRAAVRNHLPPPARPAASAPPPVPPTPKRRALREVPPPELLVDHPFDLFTSPAGRFEVHPLPGGCLVSSGPRRRRRSFWL